VWDNGLFFNPDKSVAALFGTRQRLDEPGWPTHVAVAGSDIKMSDHLKVLGVTLDSSMALDTQVTATVRTCNFHLPSLRQLRGSLPPDDDVTLVPSLDRGWTTATLCITACQTTIFKGYRECRMLPHELVAKLHDANVTQPTFIRISIGYQCEAESTTRVPSSVIKPSNCNNRCILLVYSRHTDSRAF